MSQYNLISSGNIIGKVFTNYKLANTGWTGDAIEWIAEALGFMRVAPAYSLTSCESEVSNFRCKIPCSLEYFGAVEYNGSIMSMHSPNGLYDKVANGVLGNVARSSHVYSLNPNFIHTDFESGTIRIHYYGFCLDEHGYPMIPDDDYVKEALAWYIVYRYLLRGDTHAVLTWDVAEDRWIRYKKQAENSVKRMTPAKYENFQNNWVSLVPQMRRQYDYYGNFENLYPHNSNQILTEPAIIDTNGTT